MYIHKLYSMGGDDCDIHVKISLFKLYRRFLGDVMHVSNFNRTYFSIIIIYFHFLVQLLSH